MSPGLTVRNSTFRNCATMDLMITRGFWWGQPPYGGLTLENNVFGHSTQRPTRTGTTSGSCCTATWASSPTSASSTTRSRTRSAACRRIRPERQRRVGQQHRRRLGLPAGHDLRRQRRQEVRRLRRRDLAVELVRSAGLLAGADDARGLGEPAAVRLPPEVHLGGDQRRQRDLRSGAGSRRQHPLRCAGRRGL